MQQQTTSRLRTRQNRAPESPDVKLSKSLSYILRHAAAKEKLPIQLDGYMNVTQLLTHPRFRGITFSDIRRVVDTNSKNRFKLEYRALDGLETANPDNPTGWWIRANQGHSVVVTDLDLEPITDTESCPVAVHGTYLGTWNKYIKSQGLSKMKRNHIHLAAGLAGESGVISGMRASSEVYIYIDIKRAIKDGIKFYKSENGVILTDGKDGVLEPQYFDKVVNKDGDTLL
ncbi:phosphotransferase KptA/Tpt1 [Lipomyces tetrasporus]|uniref:2'-phosphotransferase n=1 Tax=Lipomyces tetrasporus TaxID=54092 RepID=A0AAD7QYN6_9ASCO|nr:phosphotransferase KptA/Tpt1 [Lipomyces tetrasporus]KAJ8103813.1 phosphotransferase KptA/Tpt1 [Lipomyces tetrasporus]